MTPQMGLFGSSILFVGLHFLLSHPLRRPLVQRLGERAFQGVYSLIALSKTKALGAAMIIRWTAAQIAKLHIIG